MRSVGGVILRRGNLYAHTEERPQEDTVGKAAVCEPRGEPSGDANPTTTLTSRAGRE